MTGEPAAANLAGTGVELDLISLERPIFHIWTRLHQSSGRNNAKGQLLRPRVRVRGALALIAHGLFVRIMLASAKLIVNIIWSLIETLEAQLSPPFLTVVLSSRRL